MKRLIGLLFYLGFVASAAAQTTFTMPPPAGVSVIGVQVVTTCNSVNLTANALAFLAMDHTGALCTNASGGGGGGGAVTLASGAVASGAYSSGSIASGAFAAGSLAAGAGVDGWDLTQGAIADAAATAGSTGSVSAKLRLATSQLGAIQTAATSAQPAGTNTIGGVFLQTTTAGGMTSFFVQPAASDNHTNVKNGAGQVYWVLAMNNSATVNYLRFYDAASGFNGCNSATNLVSQIQIPASTSVGGVNISIPMGLVFATGISICVTSAYATTDTTNATATAMSLTIGYK